MSNSFTVNTYSPSDVQLIIGGYTVSGWQSLSISRRTESFRTIPGIRGKHTRVPSRDTSATISFPILQTSQANEVMSYIHELDIEEGTGRLSLILKDNSGTSVFSSDEAYIVGYPEAMFSDGFEYRAWRIFCQTTKSYTIGGNTRGATSVFDTAVSEISNFASNIF